jgi:hypothetical protein
MTLEKFEVRNRWTNAVQFTAEIEVTPDMAARGKLGLAVKWGVKSRADLSGADLYGADLSGAKNSELVIARTRILPEGDLIGWKKCLNGVIVKLRIPEASPRSHAFGRKCRAQFVDVLEVIGADEGIAQHDRKTTYRAGERVEAPNWSDNWQEECAGGIHFYISRIEAEAY